MLRRSKRSGLKNESSLERRRGKIKRFLFYGVPALALLWTGCQRVNEQIAGMGFSSNLRYSLLSDYQYKHHVWPATLDDIERDLESSRPGSEKIVGGFGWTCRTFHPVMTVLEHDKDHILVDIKFCGHSYHDKVFADSQLAAEAEEQAESQTKLPELPITSSPKPANRPEDNPQSVSPIRASGPKR